MTECATLEDEEKMDILTLADGRRFEICLDGPVEPFSDPWGENKWTTHTISLDADGCEYVTIRLREIK